jgi:hypothetical protein
VSVEAIEPAESNPHEEESVKKSKHFLKFGYMMPHQLELLSLLNPIPLKKESRN